MSCQFATAFLNASMLSSAKQMAIEQVLIKLKQVLHCLLQPNFTLRNDCYLNRLLTHLTTDDKSQDFNGLLFDWLAAATNHRTPLLSDPVKAFIINVVAALASNEDNFQRVNPTRITQLIDTIGVYDNSSVSPSIKLAFINLLTQCLHHKSGQLWLKDGAHWRPILTMILSEQQTVYILRDGRRLIQQVITTETNDINLLATIINGLDLSDMLSNENQPMPLHIYDSCIHRKLLPTVKLIGDILENSLLAVVVGGNTFECLLTDFQLQTKIESIKLLARSADLLYHLDRIIALIHLYRKNDDLIESLMAIMNMHINRGYDENLTKFAFFMVDICCKIESHPMVVKQFLPFQLLPVLGACQYLRDLCSTTHKKQQPTLDLNPFKQCNLTQIVITALDQYWQSLHQKSSEKLIDLATKSLLYLMKTWHLYNTQHQLLLPIVFDSLVMHLDQIRVENISLAGILANSIVYTNVLCLLIDTITDIVQKSNDGCVKSHPNLITSMIINYLEVPIWKATFTVKLLKLLTETIEKNNHKSSSKDLTQQLLSVRRLEPILYGKLHDSAWEVRDSAIELCQRLIRELITNDSKVPALIIQMCSQDGEGFVRATAVHCVHQMAMQDLFHLKQLNVLHVLREETEGIVRREAATLIAILHEKHQHVDTEIYGLMTDAATSDLHWEVKLRALRFWQSVIDCTLRRHDLMADAGKGSAHAYSLALQELSENGCLHVLRSCSQDADDVTVSEMAIGIVKQLGDAVKWRDLDDYDSSVRQCENTTSHQLGPSLGGSEGKEPVVHQFRSGDDVTNLPQDAILEDILNTRDAHLLANICNHSDGPSEKHSNVSGTSGTTTTVVTVKSFVEFALNINLDAQMRSRSDWFESIDNMESLLDDMLGTYDDTVNHPDCY